MKIAQFAVCIAIACLGVVPADASGQLRDILKSKIVQTEREGVYAHQGWWSTPQVPKVAERPASRKKVICDWWCPSGYTRRDVTIGPSCKWYHGLGKCVDRTAYRGESCGFAARTCRSGVGLTCEEATPEERQKNAHSQACH